MTIEELFLNSIDDLQKRVTSGVPEYDVVGISSLLRKLLLDEKPLVHLVNRKLKKKFKFQVNIIEPIWKRAGSPPPTIWAQQDGFDPATAMNPLVSNVKLDEMLARVIIISEGYEITVKEVIQHTAHVKGGVHAGKSSTPKEEALDRLAEKWRLGGYEPGIRALQAIGRVVIRGLEPLTTALKANRERHMPT
jgi:hypothetical protein